MKVSELLGADRVFLDFRAHDKHAAIEGLVDLLIARGAISPAHRAAALDALFARERLATTGMEHGVALPHATVEFLDQAVAAVALSPTGVPFESMDGQPARILILLIIPRRMVQAHVRTLAAIARLLDSERMRQELLAADRAEQIIDVIRREESEPPPR